MHEHVPDILLLQETHLRPVKSTIPNYNVYHNDYIKIISSRPTRGTAICVTNSHIGYPATPPPLDIVEAIGVTIKIPVSLTRTLSFFFLGLHAPL